MTKTKEMSGSTVLQKKLGQLEHLLHGVVSGVNPNDLYGEIEHRFGFAKKLLTAEINSRRKFQEVGEGCDDEEEMVNLTCMLEKLTELEDSFKHWTGSMTEQEMLMLENGGGFDVETGPVCSCTEFCPKEGGESDEEDVKAEEELEEEFLDGLLLEEKTAVASALDTPETAVMTAAQETAEGKSAGARLLVGVFGLMGFLVGMVSFFGYFDDHVKDNVVFVTPT